MVVNLLGADGGPDFPAGVALVVQKRVGPPDNHDDVGSAERTGEEILTGAAGVHIRMTIKSAASEKRENRPVFGLGRNGAGSRVDRLAIKVTADDDID